MSLRSIAEVIGLSKSQVARVPFGTPDTDSDPEPEPEPAVTIREHAMELRAQGLPRAAEAVSPGHRTATTRSRW